MDHKEVVRRKLKIMSTHSRIAIKTKEGIFKSIYCHFDGRDVGGVLVEHYTDEQKVIDLIELGDISYLEPEIFPTENHSFREPQKGITVFYGRDRGESGTEYLRHRSEKELRNESDDITYLYENGVWYSLYNHLPKKILKSF